MKKERFQEQIRPVPEEEIPSFLSFSGVCAPQGSEGQAWAGSHVLVLVKLPEVGTDEQVYQAA